MTCSSWTRRGELCALRWSDTYLDGKHDNCPLDRVAHLHIEGTMQRVEGELQTMPPKTRSGHRAVPLATSAVALLERQRGEQLRRRMKVGPAWMDADLIIDGDTANRSSPTR